MIRSARLAMAAGALLAACGDGGGADPAAGTGGQTTSSAVTSTGTSSSAGSGGLSGTGGTGGGGGDSPRCASDDGSPEHIVQLAASGLTSLATTSRGRVACWGLAQYGECADALNGAPLVLNPQWIPGLACIQQADISAVGFALDDAGAVVGWGTEFEEELGDGPGNSTQLGALASVRLFEPASAVQSDHAGGHATLADGVYVWGTISDTVTWNAPRAWPLADGAHFFRSSRSICELARDGRATCQGDNRCGEVGDGTFEPRRELVDVATQARFATLVPSAGFTCGITLSHELYCWGSNRWATLGIGEVPPDGAFSDEETSVPIPTRVVGLQDVASVDLDYYGGCAVDGHGDVRCWGQNRYQRFGPEDDVFLFSTPVELPDLAPARTVAVGEDHVCVLKLDDTVWCRGRGICRAFDSGTPVEATQMHFDFEAPL